MTNASALLEMPWLSCFCCFFHLAPALVLFSSAKHEEGGDSSKALSIPLFFFYSAERAPHRATPTTAASCLVL